MYLGEETSTMTRLVLISLLVLLAACEPSGEAGRVGVTPTQVPTPTAVPSASTLALDSPECHAAREASSLWTQVSISLQSSLSHPNDSSAVASDMESVDANLEKLKNVRVEYYRSIWGDIETPMGQVSSLRRQLQQDPLVATSNEFGQEFKALQETLGAIQSEVTDAYGRWCAPP